ncbi:hypothetical protein BDF22DRAFT_742122 [Syncephalis plumigaleata]|nr:hypothetical protein BDF22DRAFT_742122 [Syncephalis plumigaleata]
MPKRHKNTEGRQAKRAKKSQKEVELEALVFGADIGDDDTLNYMGQESVQYDNDNDSDDTPALDQELSGDEAAELSFSVDTGDQAPSMEFTIDTGFMEEADEESENEEEATSDIDDTATNTKKAAWEDEDDEKLTVSLMERNRLRKLRTTETETEVKGDEYQRRLRRQFEQSKPKPKWALTASDLLTQSASLLSKASVHLPSGKLDVERVKDVSQPSKNKTRVVAVDFHPNGQIDGKRNEKIQSVLFKDLRIGCAKFDHAGRHIIVTGRRTYFYIYDVESGQISRIPQLRPRTSNVKLLADRFSISPNDKRWIGDIRVNKGVADIAWSMDGHHLYVLSTESEVYRWNIETLACVHRFHDHGGFAPTCLAVSTGDRYLAIGSNSGMVNLYDQSSLETSSPRPVKTFDNLITPIHGLQFSSDAQLLCMYSTSKKDQLRMIHTASRTVFSNWPTTGTPLSHVQAVGFSPHTGYLTIGNDKGRTLLYRMRHYGQA